MSTNRLVTRFDDKKIDSIFGSLNQNELAGAAVGVAIRGVPVYRKGFGLANMELPVVLSPAVRMRIASVTKHMTAFTWMLLCEEGRASLDDPIGKVLPELHPTSQRATPRQLMGHISGLRDSVDLSWHFCGTGWPVSSAQLFSLYRDINDVNATPETRWTYNNGAYLLLSTAIERITGQSLEEVMRQRIFDPVGMPDTLLRRLNTNFIPNSAALHTMNKAGEFEKCFARDEVAGEGGVVSTVNDMLRWLAHMDDPTVGSGATWNVMKAPMQLANGTSTEYGLGLIARRYRGVDVISHSGGAAGGTAYMLKVPAAGLDVVVMANRQGVPSHLLAYEIADACISPLAPKPEPFKGPFTSGVFRSLRSGRVAHFFEKSGRQIVSIDGADYPYFEPDSQGVLRPTEQYGGKKITVTLAGDRERPSNVMLNDYGNVDELGAVVPANPDAIEAIAGRYRAPAVGVTARIVVSDSGPKLATTGPFGSVTYSLESLGQDLWRGNPPTGMMLSSCVLSFSSSHERFSFSNCRTYAVKFQRE